MAAVIIVTVLPGTAFLLFGYFIFFKKKYHLINGFTADFQAGRKDERYARRIGLIEFILGIVLLVFGVILLAAA